MLYTLWQARKAGRLKLVPGLFLAALLTWSAPCPAIGDLALSALAQKGLHLEIIQALQPEVSAGKDISGFQLLLLMGAYYESRQYGPALAAAEVMERHFAEGRIASSMFGADLSPYPQLIRAAVALDQGDQEKTVKLAGETLGRLNPDQHFFRQQAIMAYGLLGTAHAQRGRTDDARKCIRQIRDVSTRMSNLGPEKFSAIARIHMALKDYRSALEAIDDRDAEVSGVLTLFYDPTFQHLPRFFIRAKSLFETNRTAEARSAFDQLLKHPQIAQYGGIYWVVLYDRARIALAEGDRAAAIELLQRAVDVIERQRSSIDTEAGRIGFVGDKQSVYQLLVLLLVSSGRDAAALEYVERSKARALVDMLASHQHFRAPTAQIDAGSALQKLNNAESSLAAMVAPNDAGEILRRGNLVAALRGELRRQAPELASLVSVTGTQARSIQMQLAPDESLIEYYYGEEALLVFVATGQSIHAVRLARANLEQDVTLFRQCIANPYSDSCQAAAQKLHARLLQPVAALLKTRRLVVVPHGVLHYLPFAAMHNGTSYVVDEFNIRMAPSASVLELIKGRTGGTSLANALVMGNPDLGKPELALRHAEEEAVSIAKLVPNARVLLRTEAVRSVVRSEGERFRVLHFAAHGTFDPHTPLNSALLLASDSEGDGRLTVRDLYSLKLDADLVTLSACETALGQLASGDDVVGFTRGLLYAGARSIVSSLWSVDDLATRDLMVSFYSGLPALGKQEALRQAQISIKKSRPHPFFWSAFVLTGRDE